MNLQARRLRRKDLEKAKIVRPRLSAREIRENTENHFKDFVVRHMNKFPESPEVRRVSRFLELFHKARSLHDRFRLFFGNREEMMTFLSQSARESLHSRPIYFSGYRFERPELQNLNAELEHTLAELHRCTSRYRWYPCVRHPDYGFPTLLIEEHWHFRNNSDSWENFSIRTLTDRNGSWIDRIRRCKTCDKWFLAIVEHQTHCTDNCRKKRASTSEEFKERRRIYMQEYRRREKETDALAQVQARRVK